MAGFNDVNVVDLIGIYEVLEVPKRNFREPANFWPVCWKRPGIIWAMLRTVHVLAVDLL